MSHITIKEFDKYKKAFADACSKTDRMDKAKQALYKKMIGHYIYNQEIFQFSNIKPNTGEILLERVYPKPIHIHDTYCRVNFLQFNSLERATEERIKEIEAQKRNDIRGGKVSTHKSNYFNCSVCEERQLVSTYIDVELETSSYEFKDFSFCKDCIEYFYSLVKKDELEETK